MNATYISKDQNWQNEQTIYWFDVDGEEYGVSEQPDEVCILDCDGYPINTDDARDIHLKGLIEMVTNEMRAE